MAQADPVWVVAEVVVVAAEGEIDATGAIMLSGETAVGKQIG